jgi:hypothetical protein
MARGAGHHGATDRQGADAENQRDGEHMAPGDETVTEYLRRREREGRTVPAVVIYAGIDSFVAMLACGVLWYAGFVMVGPPLLMVAWHVFDVAVNGAAP